MEDFLKPEWIEGCLKRDRRAEQALYEASYGYLMSVTRRYAHSADDASDFMNQSFLKILKSLDKFHADESFKAWAMAIAARTCIDNLRQRKRYISRVQTHDEEHLKPFENSIHDWNSGAEKLQAEDLLKMILDLPDLTREVFNLCAVDGFSHKEVAHLLDITETASRWHLHRGRQLLKERIALTNRFVKVA